MHSISKNILKKLWSAKLDWDAELPDDLMKKWVQFRNDLNALNDLQITRQVTCKFPMSIEIHGFCDASMEAYGACLHLRSVDSQGIQVRLLCSKTRVAPLKPLTISRLELCSTVLLSRLLLKIKDSSLQYSTYLWSDSQIVFGWIQTQPRLFQTFV